MAIEKIDLKTGQAEPNALHKRRFFPVMLALFLTLLLGIPGALASQARRSNDGASSSQRIRWTGAEDKNAEFLHLVESLNQRTGFQLSPSDFLLVEDRSLAHHQFRMYVQTAGGIPLHQRTIRLWTNLFTGEAVQVEALVESDQQVKMLKGILAERRPQLAKIKRGQSLDVSALLAVKSAIQIQGEDVFFREVSFREMWDKNLLIRAYKVKAKLGVHRIRLGIDPLKVLSHDYTPFANADLPPGFSNEADEFSIPALVYPIYEEVNSIRQNRVVAQLRHLKKKTVRASSDIYAGLRNRHYLEDMQDPILGLTQEGQAQGYWAMADLKERAAALRAAQSATENTFAAGGVLLEGRYATVSLHPDVLTAFSGLKFTPGQSSFFRPIWSSFLLNNEEVSEVIPSSGLLGRPLTSFEDAFQRPARRLPDHNPVEYINDGFDEVQVYFAINSLFDSLHSLGFTDFELSTRPFHAYLYDPAISMRNNAYYTDDTINFTTYSGDDLNYARDNSTIWHELGHGVMDRLMGDSLQLADTGGLSEGMADFVAELVVQSVTHGIPFDGSGDFRIVNKIGFNLTNEVHDDGEAYGGAMRDLLMAAIEKYGRDGLLKVGDLTLETMRLCRNHPGLTAELWFSHMLFADQLGQGKVRAPGELAGLIAASIAGRNFSFAGSSKSAKFNIMHAAQFVESGSEGSRNRPIRVSLPPEGKASFNIQITAEDGDEVHFQYPMTVKVQLRGGPLQGAIHWEGEENRVLEYPLQGPGEVLSIDLTVTGRCDEVNRGDGSCVDFAYIQLWPLGASSPIGKKRFYLRLKNP